MAHNSSGTVGSLKYLCYMGAMENEGQNFVSGAPYDNGYGTGYSALVEVTNISSAPVTVSNYALGVQPPGQESSLFSILDNSAADLPQTIQPGQTGGWTMQDLPPDVGDHGTACWLDSYR